MDGEGLRCLFRPGARFSGRDAVIMLEQAVEGADVAKAQSVGDRRNAASGVLAGDDFLTRAFEPRPADVAGHPSGLFEQSADRGARQAEMIGQAIDADVRLIKMAVDMAPDG